ncbi:MAG: S24 family peptidase [Candidatus Saccharimonadales bacterium]
MLYQNYKSQDSGAIDSGVSVHEGFPNPATDTSLQPIDLNSLLVPRRASTYLMRISGDDWADQGIFAGDIAIIDKALSANSNDLVAWIHEDSFVLSPRHAVAQDAEVWGTITAVIHQYIGAIAKDINA